MAEQPSLFPNPQPPTQNGHRPRRLSPATGTTSAATASADPSADPDVSTRPIPVLSRIEAIVRIVVRLYLGLLILVLPWLPFWTQNNLFTYSSVLLTLASSGFFRGLVSGLGLLNIFIAVVEAKNAPELS